MNETERDGSSNPPARFCVQGICININNAVYIKYLAQTPPQIKRRLCFHTRLFALQTIISPLSKNLPLLFYTLAFLFSLP